jgi:hypothetical protein
MKALQSSFTTYVPYLPVDSTALLKADVGTGSIVRSRMGSRWSNSSWHSLGAPNQIFVFPKVTLPCLKDCLFGAKGVEVELT